MDPHLVIVADDAFQTIIRGLSRGADERRSLKAETVLHRTDRGVRVPEKILVDDGLGLKIEVGHESRELIAVANDLIKHARQFSRIDVRRPELGRVHPSVPDAVLGLELTRTQHGYRLTERVLTDHVDHVRPMVPQAAREGAQIEDILELRLETDRLRPETPPAIEAIDPFKLTVSVREADEPLPFGNDLWVGIQAADQMTAAGSSGHENHEGKCHERLGYRRSIVFETGMTEYGESRGSRSRMIEMTSNQPSLARDLVLGGILLVAMIATEAILYPLVVSPAIDAAWNGESGFGWLNDAVAARVAADPGLYDLEHLHWMGRTLATRIGMLLFAGLCCWIGWRHRDRLAELLRTFFTAKDTPFNIGVFRFVVFGMLYAFSGADDLAHYSSLPQALHFPPVGLGPMLAKMPANPELAEVTLVCFRICTLLAMFGVFTRVTTVLTTILALYVFGIPQMFGKVNHSHHMVWFAAMLASSRCGDALSVDALVARLRKRPAPGTAVAYALPLRIIWVLLGLIYFFPGYWKLWGGGVDWIFGDHLRYQMYHLWSTHQNPTSIPFLSESKVLVTLGGIATIVFELLFICLIFTRRTRGLAVVAGLLFHTSVGITLRIAFHTLQLSFISLIDWRWLLARIGILASTPDVGRSDGRRDPSPIPVAIVGVAIIVPVIFLGFKGENNGWPFACYPRFSYPIFEPERDRIEFEVTGSDGRAIENNTLDDVRRKFRTARWIGLLRRTLLTSDPELLQRRLQALLELSDSDPEAGSTVRFYRATYSTIPEDWGDPPIRREMLSEFEMKPGQ
jgi:hypothetical protein